MPVGTAVVGIPKGFFVRTKRLFEFLSLAEKKRGSRTDSCCRGGDDRGRCFAHGHKREGKGRSLSRRRKEKGKGSGRKVVANA